MEGGKCLGLPSPPLCHGVNLRWRHPGLHHQTNETQRLGQAQPPRELCLPSFGGDSSVPRGVTLISSILPWQRERRAAGGKKKKRQSLGFPCSQAGHRRELCAKGLTGAQPSAAEHEITSTGQEKGWLCMEGPGFSPQRGAKVK